MNRTGLILIIVFIVLAIITTVLLIVLLPNKQKKSFAMEPQNSIGADDTTQQTFVQDPRLEKYTQQTSLCDDPDFIEINPKCKILKYLSDPEKFYIPNIEKIIPILNQVIDIDTKIVRTPQDLCTRTTLGIELLKLFIGLNDTNEQIEQNLNGPKLILFKFVNQIMTGEVMTNIRNTDGEKVDFMSFDCKENMCTDMDSINSVSIILPTGVINLTDLTFSMPYLGLEDVPFTDKSPITKEDSLIFINAMENTLYTMSALQFRQILAIQAYNGIKVMKTEKENCDDIDSGSPTGSGDVSGTPLAMLYDAHNSMGTRHSKSEDLIRYIKTLDDNLNIQTDPTIIQEIETQKQEKIDELRNIEIEIEQLKPSLQSAIDNFINAGGDMNDFSGSSYPGVYYSGSDQACGDCNTYMCDENGKYLYHYSRDTQGNSPQGVSNEWPHVGWDYNNDLPMYTTTKGDGCYIDENNWPRIQKMSSGTGEQRTGYCLPYLSFTDQTKCEETGNTWTPF